MCIQHKPPAVICRLLFKIIDLLHNGMSLTLTTRRKIPSRKAYAWKVSFKLHWILLIHNVIDYYIHVIRIASLTFNQCVNRKFWGFIQCLIFIVLKKLHSKQWKTWAREIDLSKPLKPFELIHYSFIISPLTYCTVAFEGVFSFSFTSHLSQGSLDNYALIFSCAHNLSDCLTMYSLTLLAIF